MRILTVRQPWAWAIIHGGKDIENRVRNIVGDYRGPVAIHVAIAKAAFQRSETTPHHEKPLGAMMRANRDIVAEGETWPWYENRGAIIGVVDLTDVHVCRSSVRALQVPACFDPITPVGEVCSPWAQFEPGREIYHLELANPRPLAEPIPYRGALGLRRLDNATAAAVLGAIA